MYEEILLNAGLSKVQARVLDYLLQNKAQKASEIAQNIKLPRGGVYRVLEELAEMGLAEKIIKQGNVAKFRAEHPAKLEKLFLQKEKQIESRRQTFLQLLPSMASAYNLAIGKPGVRFYEGIEGIKQVLLDSLSAQGEILSYLDPSTIDKHFDEINKEYAKQRCQARIVKKILVQDRPENRERYSQVEEEFTKLRYVRDEWSEFKTSMQIYNNKISYITLAPEKVLGVIIEDKLIAQMHRDVFNSLWKRADN